jgi:hypothetical protein
MKLECDRLRETLLNQAELTGAQALHAETCAECRDQMQSHRELTRALAALPVPQLSPVFAGVVTQTVSRTAPKRAPWTRAVELAYWFAFAVMGIALLSRIPAPHIPDLRAWLPLFIPLGFSLLIFASSAQRWIAQLFWRMFATRV